MIRKYLVNKLTDVTAGVASKVYPLVAPQNTSLPFITFQTVEAPADENFNQVPGIDFDKIQINCWARDLLTAETIHNAVREVLEVVDTETFDGKIVSAIQFERATDELEETGESFYIMGVYNVRIHR